MSAKGEDEIFVEFKSRIQSHLDPEKNFLHQDHYLRKWLVARDFNINKAEKMFIDNVEFRNTYKVEEILKDYNPSEILKTYTTGGIVGYDKEGNVVRIELFGKLDMKGIMYTTKTVEIEKMKILECEQIVEMWRKWNEEHPGSFSDGMTVIFDMEGVTSRVMWRPGITMYLHLIKLLEDNYPEMLKRLFVINSPSIFPFLWSICKPLLSERTKKKIHVLGKNRNDELIKYIDADVLPQIYGGNKTDTDGNTKCSSQICQGGIVPIELYSSQTENIKDCINIHIPAGSTHSIKKKIEKLGSIIRWEFRTHDHDLGVGLFYIDDKSEKNYLIPIHRVNCHMVPEDGSHMCDELGEYELILDNSYSVARSKSVDFYCEVLDSDESYKTEITCL